MYCIDNNPFPITEHGKCSELLQGIYGERREKPTHSLYVSNMEEKMANDEFTGDTASLLRPDEKYNPNEAYEIVKAQIIDKLIVPEENEP